jgi:RNA polymerase sigma-70 factor (ECF subfamily)
MPADADSFVTVYAQHLSAIGGYLGRRVESRFVEDLAADVFAIAWRKRDRVTAGEELPWLYRIAAHVVANHRRKQAASASFLAGLRAVDSAPAAEDIVIADQTLAAAWARLRPRDREVLGLALLDDLPIPSIAATLGISPNAVSIRVHRAKKALGDLLRETGETDSERSAPVPT